MGEIKSTLDLVMEKTKHLTLSREERAQQKHKEAGQRVRGLIQKYQDRVLNEDKFAKEWDDLQEIHGVMVKDVMINALLDGLRVDRGNEAQLTLLETVCGKDTAGLASVFAGFRDELSSMTQERSKVLKEVLAEKRSISGTAVVPNVKTDQIWRETVKKIKDKFDQLLNREKAGFKQTQIQS